MIMHLLEGVARDYAHGIGDELRNSDGSTRKEDIKSYVRLHTF